MSDTLSESRPAPVDAGSSETGTTVPIALRDFTKEYGTGESVVRAVDDVSLEIESQSVVGLLGPNGAGKTTTIKSILGLLIPTEGEIRINGIDPHRNSCGTYRHVSAVLEGARNVYWRLTVRENLRFFAGLQGTSPSQATERHDSLLRKLSLADKADEPVRTLSRGMKQKVALACALARETPIVFLDEPTLGLDVETSRDLRSELRRLADDENRTVVMSSHDMDVIQDTCDRVIIMNDGQVIVDDSIENLLELFHTQAYRITLQEGFSEHLVNRLDMKFDVHDRNRRSDCVVFDVHITDDKRLYDLMDALRKAGAVVDTITSVDPDLEEVFLTITEGNSATAIGGDRR